MNRRRTRTVSFSYPHAQIERQIDSFLESFKKRSAAAMERAQSLQGGTGGLLWPPEEEPPPVTKTRMRSPRKGSKVKFHIPRRKHGKWSESGVPRSKSGVSVMSSGSDSGSDSIMIGAVMHTSLPHSLADWGAESDEDLQGKTFYYFFIHKKFLKFNTKLYTKCKNSSLTLKRLA